MGIVFFVFGFRVSEAAGGFSFLYTSRLYDPFEGRRLYIYMYRLKDVLCKNVT